MWLIVGLVVFVVLIASLRTLAIFYTDYLWFGSVGLSHVWDRLLAVKAGLFIGFAAAFFVMLWVNLYVVDRLAPSELVLGPEDELVRRYQHTVAPHNVLVRSVVAVVFALIAASGAIGQWQNYLLFVDGVPFGTKDPQFHKDIGFFVFKLPFLTFLVSWAFISLIVITIVTLIAHYLNGGVRVQGKSPRVAPQVKAHLSVLLACIALVKAFGYLFERYSLDTSTNGYVQGATYTDVHARIPALTLLLWISVAAVGILLVNIRRRGWALPVLAVGLWAFVAIVVGAIYPAVVQALKVNPAQGQLEEKYIARNIEATRVAFGINNVQQEPFSASQSITTADLLSNIPTLNAVRLWDPTVTAQTYTREQQIRSYYTFNTLAVDRYMVNGQLAPVIVGVRQINSDLPATGWVNEHLQYTHGYGMIVSPANEATQSNGQPIFAIQNVPPTSNSGLPNITQPSVYFGLSNPAGGDVNYVVANTGQSEIDYQRNNGTNQETHYAGDGGIPMSEFNKLAFALRFGDYNLAVSSLITSKSRIMFVRDITQMVQKAAPFLSLDSDPYPVIVNGGIDWVQDAYTTTDRYPYSQDADPTILPLNSGLQQTFNYVRNSVKVVVNAYTGKMTFYVMDPNDPIIRTWERIFPGMFTSASKMPAELRAHLRYPEDMFMTQAQMYGRYHITNAPAFYNAGDAWTLSQDPGSGSPDSQAQPTYTTTPQGQLVPTGQTQRMAPEYQVLEVPGQSQPTFNIMDAYVPFSNSNQIQTLSGFMVGGSDPGQYGKLTAFVTPAGQAVDGPSLVEGRIQENQGLSQKISLLNQGGSTVLFSNVLMVPIDQSMLYFRSLYVQASRNAVPELTYVIVAFSGTNGTNNNVAYASTLSGALQQLFQGFTLPSTGTGPTGGSSVGNSVGGSVTNSRVHSLATLANQQFQQAEADLKAGNFSAYGNDLNALESTLQQLQEASGVASTSSSSSTTTVPGTTTTKAGSHGSPGSSFTTTPSKSGQSTTTKKDSTTTSAPSGMA
ncbi:MAG TPA: UPF0182 family protein [Acidimicrobiales bacterium]|nr:UPF0182 family protein [Acidimicrobiales bacterium]